MEVMRGSMGGFGRGACTVYLHLFEKGCMNHRFLISLSTVPSGSPAGHVRVLCCCSNRR